MNVFRDFISRAPSCAAENDTSASIVTDKLVSRQSADQPPHFQDGQCRQSSGSLHACFSKDFID